MGIPVRALLREKGTLHAALALGDANWTDNELIDFIMAHPILINRPTVVTPKGVGLCRPSWLMLDMLEKPLPPDFIKEDGKRIRGTAYLSSWRAGPLSRDAKLTDCSDQSRGHHSLISVWRRYYGIILYNK